MLDFDRPDAGEKWFMGDVSGLLPVGDTMRVCVGAVRSPPAPERLSAFAEVPRAATAPGPALMGVTCGRPRTGFALTAAAAVVDVDGVYSDARRLAAILDAGDGLPRAGARLG